MQGFPVPRECVEEREDGEEVDFIDGGGKVQREEDAVLVFQALECRLVDRGELFVECGGVDLLKDQQRQKRGKGTDGPLCLRLHGQHGMWPGFER